MYRGYTHAQELLPRVWAMKQKREIPIDQKNRVKRYVDASKEKSGRQIKAIFLSAKVV